MMPALTVNSVDIVWVNDNPKTLSCLPEKTPAALPVFHGRRRHTKSRLGCGTCKRRRVKCDENKPKCGNCAQQRIQCDYLKLPSSPSLESNPPRENPWSSAATASLNSNIVEAQLRGISMSGRNGTLTSKSFARCPGGSLIEILHHFKHIASSTIGTSKTQHTMRTSVLKLAHSSPLLISAILAFSAHHLHSVRPEDEGTGLTAIYHRQITLQWYTQVLTKEPTNSDVNAVVAAGFLVSAVAFFKEDSSPSTSFIFSDDESEANWLAVLSSLAALLQRKEIKQALPSSIWEHIAASSRGFEPPESTPGEEDPIPVLFAQLCRITDASTCDSNPYHGELRLLTRILAVHGSSEAFAELIQFPCRMDPAFNALIRRKDPVALLMLAYWLAKLMELDLWWLRARARSELFAICSYLDGWPDERFDVLLRYPMETCGYVPVLLDGMESCVRI